MHQRPPGWAPRKHLISSNGDQTQEVSLHLHWSHRKTSTSTVRQYQPFWWSLSKALTGATADLKDTQQVEQLTCRHQCARANQQHHPADDVQAMDALMLWVSFSASTHVIDFHIWGHFATGQLAGKTGEGIGEEAALTTKVTQWHMILWEWSPSQSISSLVEDFNCTKVWLEITITESRDPVVRREEIGPRQLQLQYANSAFQHWDMVGHIQEGRGGFGPTEVRSVWHKASATKCQLLVVQAVHHQ